MRLFKIIGALVVVLAFSAVAVATASAAETLWKWLPGSAHETMTGKSGKAVLSALDPTGTIGVNCVKSLVLLTDEGLKASSELLEEGSTAGKDATLALLIIHFEGCNAAGVEAHSSGDPEKIILVHVEEHNCMIKAGDFGALLLVLPLTIEVPKAKLNLSVRGSVIGLLEGKEGEKKLTFGLNLKTKNKEGKVQEFTKCEGGTEDKLEGSLEGVTFFPALEEAQEGFLSFDMTKDVNGEEMMEK